jgi:hypothetical protein
VNSAYAAGLASLDGYGTPMRRFSQLVFALRGDRYEPTANFFRLPAGDPAFAVLRQLYNVGWNVTLPAPGQLALGPLGPTAGPAWFSASTVRLENLATVARELRGAGETLARRTKEVLWIDESDFLAARADVPATLDERCRDARMLAVDAPRRAHTIVATVSADATCPFTFATNFTEDLRVTVVLAGGRRAALNPFPGYGALTSVMVPATATEIRLHVEPPRLPLAIGWVALGLACCGAGRLADHARALGSGEQMRPNAKVPNIARVTLMARTAVFVGCVLPFLRVLSHGFIAVDDQVHTYLNPFLNGRATGGIWTFWTSAYGGLYIPVTYTAWAVIHALGRGGATWNALPFHCTNLILHAVNGLLAFELLRYLLLSMPSSLSAFAQGHDV